MARNRNWEAWIVSFAIISTFTLFHISFPSRTELNSRYDRADRLKELNFDEKRLSVREPLLVNRYHNRDASLSVPFLEKINKYWFVKGSADIKNREAVRLIKIGQKENWGMLLSSGTGDNILNDFEVVFDFSVETAEGKQQGEGLVFVITPFNDFMTADLRSSYARAQYQFHTNLDINNHDLMGFPRNLPGLALVIDTFSNDIDGPITAPFISLFFNNDTTMYYDAQSDGHLSTSSKLMSAPLITNEERHRVRIIYLECVGYLKVDIDYGAKDKWVELYKQEKNLQLPKEPTRGQRYIGAGALNKQSTQTVRLHNIDTYEYHWIKGEEDSQIESSFDYVKEITRFFKWQLGEEIHVGEDDYVRWSKIRSQMKHSSYRDKPKASSGIALSSFIKRSLLWSLFALAVYVSYLHLRGSLKAPFASRKQIRKDSITFGILG